MILMKDHYHFHTPFVSQHKYARMRVKNVMITQISINKILIKYNNLLITTFFFTFCILDVTKYRWQIKI